MRTRLSPTWLALALAVFLAVNCLHANEPRNLSALKQEIDNYVDSGRYLESVAKVANQANRYLTRRIPRGAPAGKKMAIIFDIDETVLSNIGHIREQDYGYVPPVWDNWVADATAPAIESVKVVYDTAVRGNVTIFFITGRKETDRVGTEKNLRAIGYPTWERIYYKPNAEKGTSGAFKLEVRRQLELEGYVIIANIGDQNSDFFGGRSERNFKLPNPFYTAH
jgi:predicted secreted acid phosphatase